MSNEDDVENLIRFIKQTYTDREYASGGRIVLPVLVQKPGTPKSVGVQTPQRVSGTILQVTVQEIQDRTRHALKQIGLMPPSTIQEYPADNESLRQKSQKSFSMRSGGSRIRAKFRRSILQVLQPKVTAQHYG
ncbi:hypothetical protein CLAFUW4_12855 [Fulvia fulva]|uniref:Uncharacterized protein n=1 Tax=Passalora fulva TaxID=5499 RepID=A0A9Q8UVI7_PASFU|nr:uncharacterized protein CLAFUR5_12721 [Fulvia fulva]KAK4612326.1 hypothetical protein CLAFUR4_12859 [Fulvia fulva]KAK4612541.1 hypothetical protein CLAFUR0_12865 [Fulvia fulva]UJO23950.1 hypothetical protein CLAFUR5_12721 [Fulvia fulva]WPV21647.1 hypothetical protein CLAFUW4_12855 [Fulvia fulva]WPV36037.1 hypothetical protein CLAFUW7_12863 [Fulvia fulva]